jgi:hypothetical protein
MYAAAALTPAIAPATGAVGVGLADGHVVELWWQPIEYAEVVKRDVPRAMTCILFRYDLYTHEIGYDAMKREGYLEEKTRRHVNAPTAVTLLINQGACAPAQLINCRTFLGPPNSHDPMLATPHRVTPRPWPHISSCTHRYTILTNLSTIIHSH